MQKPLIALTMGDAAGVGPEVIAGCWPSGEIHDLCRPVAVGHPDILRRAVRLWKIPAEVVEVAVIGVADEILGEAIKAFVVVTGAAVTEAQVRAHLQRRLAPFAQPKFVEFTAMGADVYIRFGIADTVAVDYTTVSDVTDAVVTPGGDEPHLIIPQGQSRHERIDSSWTHFAHIGSTADGYLYAAPATGDSD